MIQQEVRTERTAWRDEGLSRRHRTWGWDCPAVDLDFLLIEYTHNQPVALIEYKNEHAVTIDFQSSGYQTLKNLANKANLPAFSVRYADDYSWWEVVALNAQGVTWVQGKQLLTEPQYVELLYRLRGASRSAK